MAKRTKQIQVMRNNVNSYLYHNAIKDETDPAFILMCRTLSELKCYEGYNYFTKDGRLSGGRNETFHHLHIY